MESSESSERYRSKKMSEKKMIFSLVFDSVLWSHVVKECLQEKEIIKF